jgi:hypothetical protein
MILLNRAAATITALIIFTLLVTVPIESRAEAWHPVIVDAL